MKKSLVALAVVPLSVAAQAQSSVTLFGLIDASVGYLSATGGGHALGLMNGENATSRLGFRGTEDLGGGLSASFWLEGQLNNDVGAGASQSTAFDFTRRSTVSLSGRFGEVRMGRDFAMSYLSLPAFDPYAIRGIGAFETFGTATGGISNINGTTRVSNSIAYFLPATSPVYGGLQIAFGERNSKLNPVANAAGISSTAANALTDRSGNYLGGRLGSTFGKANLAVGYGVYADAVRTVGSSAHYADDYRVGNVAGSYDFSVVKVSALYQRERMDGRGTAPAYALDSYFVAASAPIGAGVVKGSVQRYEVKNSNAEATKFAVGYTYNLSKRTGVYVDLARFDNRGTGTFTYSLTGGSLALPAVSAGGVTNGVSIGVKHAF